VRNAVTVSSCRAWAKALPAVDDKACAACGIWIPSPRLLLSSRDCNSSSSFTTLGSSRLLVFITSNGVTTAPGVTGGRSIPPMEKVTLSPAL
jgi:hypothetical protein